MGEALAEFGERFMSSGYDPEGERAKLGEIAEFAMQAGVQGPAEFLTLMAKMDTGGQGQAGLIDRVYGEVLKSRQIQLMRKMRAHHSL